MANSGSSQSWTFTEVPGLLRLFPEFPKILPKSGSFGHRKDRETRRHFFSKFAFTAPVSGLSAIETEVETDSAHALFIGETIVGTYTGRSGTRC